MAEATKKIRRLTASRIDKIIEKHLLWLLQTRHQLYMNAPPGEMADLSNVSLVRANLSGVDLRQTNFENADVEKVVYDREGDCWGNRRGSFKAIRIDGCYGSQR